MTDYKNIPDNEKKKLQKQFHENDLNYFSSFAIEDNAITKKDLEDVFLKLTYGADTVGGTP